MAERIRLIFWSMALLAALTVESWAAHRAYVMNGLYVGTGLAKIAGRLRERGYIVAYVRGVIPQIGFDGSETEQVDHTVEARHDRYDVNGVHVMTRSERPSKAKGCGKQQTFEVALPNGDRGS